MKPEIIEVVGIIPRKGVTVKCICPVCRNEFITLRTYINTGTTTTCGCKRRIKKLADTLKYGNEIYGRWVAMRRRIKHEPTYVEKGITLCSEWLDFKTFYDWAIEEFRPDLEIDRKDNKLGYSPENCNWVTRLENLRNRDKQTKLRYSLSDQTKTIRWAR